FYSISAPIQQGLWKAGGNVSDFFGGVLNSQNLKKENDELRLKLQEKEAEIVSLQELKRENETLREALQIGLAEEFKLVFVEVTGKDISGDYIVINKGEKDGISIDMSVISEQKTLIGKISETYDSFSKITLISNKNFSFDAKISNSDIYGIIKGKGNLNLSLELVPRDSEIKEGDLVSTASLGGVFPEGILVGSIESVKKSDVESFQTAEIKPLFDINNLYNLFVIIDF
ncbi:rod shape-determining protein MreC, partial [Patescibacteria group bacterium]